jgi:DNA-binding transcriptional MerR regulator
VGMLNTKEAAKFLGLKESTLRGWRCAGIGPPFYAISPQRVFYDEADLNKYKADRRVVPSIRKGATGIMRGKA